MKSKQSGALKSTNEALFHQLAVLIKARHVQLGGYSHDEHEHLLEARRLLQIGQESQARLEIQLALQKRALHKRESLKYHNLVTLRDTLQEARRNVSVAQIMQDGVSELSSTPLLVSMHGQEEEDEEEPTLPSATDEEVAAELALLRLPPTPTGGAVAVAVPVAICK